MTKIHFIIEFSGGKEVVENNRQAVPGSKPVRAIGRLKRLFRYLADRFSFVEVRKGNQCMEPELEAEAEEEPEESVQVLADEEDMAVAEVKVAEGRTSEPLVSELQMAELQATEPKVSESQMAEPQVSALQMLAAPQVFEPESTVPQSSAFQVLELQVSEPDTCASESSEPESSEPESSASKAFASHVSAPELFASQSSAPTPPWTELIQSLNHLSPDAPLTAQELAELEKIPSFSTLQEKSAAYLYISRIFESRAAAMSFIRSLSLRTTSAQVGDLIEQAMEHHPHLTAREARCNAFIRHLKTLITFQRGSSKRNLQMMLKKRDDFRKLGGR
jgi:hypothetical protein